VTDCQRDIKQDPRRGLRMRLTAGCGGAGEGLQRTETTRLPRSHCGRRHCQPTIWSSDRVSRSRIRAVWRRRLIVPIGLANWSLISCRDRPSK